MNNVTSQPSITHSIQKAENKPHKNSFLYLTLLLLLVCIGFITALLIKNTDLNKQLAEQGSALEISNQVTNLLEPDSSFDLLKQITEVPTNLNVTKDFKCVDRFKMKTSELSEFELNTYNEFFLDNTKELGYFCTRKGNMVLASYSDSKESGLIFVEENLNSATFTLFQNDVGSVSLADFKLISWNENEVLFVARDTAYSNGLQNRYMLTYYVDIESLGFAEPRIKVVETCKYGVAPGTNERGFSSCTLLENNQKSSFVDPDELW